jgi:hypothetical protein
MANGNPYAPLYNSVQARGNLAPLGTPGALKPDAPGKSLTQKAFGALGSMMDEALEEEKVSKKERYAQLIKRNEDLESRLKSRKDVRKINKDGDIVYSQGPILIQDPNLPEEIRNLGLKHNMVLNPDYVPALNQFEDDFAGDVSKEEAEHFHNLREIEAFENRGRHTSGFPESYHDKPVAKSLNNMLLYPNYKSKYFDEQPTVRRQSDFGKLLKYVLED